MSAEQGSFNSTDRYKKYVAKAQTAGVPIAMGAALEITEESQRRATPDNTLSTPIHKKRNLRNWITGKPEPTSSKPNDLVVSEPLPEPDQALFEFAEQVDNFSASNWTQMEQTLRAGWPKGKFRWLESPVETLLFEHPDQGNAALFYSAFKAAGQIAYVTRQFGADLNQHDYDLLESDLMATSTARTAGEILFREQLSQQGYDFPYLKVFLNKEKRDAALADTTLAKKQIDRALARKQFINEITHGAAREIAQVAAPVIMSLSIFGGSYAFLEGTGITQIAIEAPMNLMVEMVNVNVRDITPQRAGQPQLPTDKTQVPSVQVKDIAASLNRLADTLFKTIEPLLLHLINLSISFNISSSTYRTVKKLVI